MALVIGAAFIVGALTSLWFGSIEPGEIALAVASGLFAAALVAGIAMVVAGADAAPQRFPRVRDRHAAHRGTATAFAPVMRGIAFGDAYVNNIEPASFTQVSGSLTIDIANPGGTPEPIVIDKRSGDTFISVAKGSS